MSPVPKFVATPLKWKCEKTGGPENAVTKHWLPHIMKSVTTPSFNYVFTAKKKCGE